eukprot:2566266-Amphidinium_carterae.1
MADFEKLTPMKSKQATMLDSLPDQLIQFAEQFRELNAQIKGLKDEVASKNAEIAQLKYEQKK